MAQKNSEYWEKRIAASTWKTYNSLEERNRDLLEFYIDASEQIKKELYLIAEKHSKDGILSLSEMHKQNRLTALNKKFEDIIEDLGHKTEKSAKKNMQGGFQAVYKNTAVSMGDEDFSIPNKKLMEKLLNEPWRGDSFSGRLWKNQKKLAVGLNDLLLTGLQQGKTATEIAVSLHNFMGQGFNECHRLVRTETMHYLNDATMQRYKDAGIKYVQIWAAEDERTCDECSKYHGKIYPIDKCPHIPFHPNCRCTIIPVTDDEMIRKYGESDLKLRDSTDKWSRKAKQELLKSEKTLGKRSKETMEVYGQDGEYKFSKRGDASSVGVSVLDIPKLRGAVVTHNHPSGGSFSFTDLKFLKRMPVSEIRVSTTEGSYYIRKPKEWSRDIGSTAKMEKAYDEIRNSLKSKYRKLYNDGKISKIDRHRLFMDEVNKTFAERYGFEYGFETHE